MNKTRVLVVDDSALMRKFISDIINEEADMEVIDTARNGEDLLYKIDRLSPNVITLDIEMPKMDGITTLKELKKRGITIPVIVLSSVTQKGTQLTMECLHLGAFDFVPKPSGGISLDISVVREELIKKIKASGQKQFIKNIEIKKDNIVVNKINMDKKRTIEQSGKVEAVVIGASTGGPNALYKVITKFPSDINVPIFVVQHMPVGFTKAFADRLNSNSNLTVVEASEGEVYKKNVVYIAPGGFHMEIGEDKKIHLNTDPSIWGVRPAVDKLFISAAKVFGKHLISAVLTGMGKDGANGTEIIKEKGGTTLAEDELTCIIYGMPKVAYETGKVDLVLPIHEIADEIVRITKK